MGGEFYLLVGKPNFSEKPHQLTPHTYIPTCTVAMERGLHIRSTNVATELYSVNWIGIHWSGVC